MKVGLGNLGLRPIVAERVRFHWTELRLGSLLQSHTVDNNGTYWTVVGFTDVNYKPRRGDRPLACTDRVELEDETGRIVLLNAVYVDNSSKWVLF